MDYKSLEKEQLKEAIVSMADVKEYTLPKSWHLLGQEKMLKLVEDIEAFEPEETETRVKGEVEIKTVGNSSMKERIMSDKKVTIFIPEDQVNNTNYIELFLNGVQFIYAREKEYEMPKCLADIYNYSMRENAKARKKMSKFNEIQ